MDDDCVDDDPCTVAERCQSRSHTCTYDVLDEDSDGFFAASCGGIDCQDGSPSVPTTRDIRDEMDDDCDGELDEDDADLAARACVHCF